MKDKNQNLYKIVVVIGIIFSVAAALFIALNL